AHRELVHVRLAQDDGRYGAELLRDVGVVRGDVPVEDLRARGALAAGQRDEVLERDGQAEERVQRIDRCAPRAPGRGELDVDGVRFRGGAIAVDRQPRIQRQVLALGDVEVGRGELARRDVAA